MLLAHRRLAAHGVSRLAHNKRRRARLLVSLAFAACAFSSVACDSIKSKLVKSKVAVAPLLEPLAEADTPQLFAEINRVAQVKSLRGKVDIQFLDTSFAKCGVVEKYTTADGDVTVERPGQIYLAIQDPFVGSKIAEMASNGTKFSVAVLKGDEKYRNFLVGTNEASYQRMADGGDVACSGGDKKKSEAMQKRAVSAFSGLRPQHFTDALLIRPLDGAGSNLIYARSETFAEETDTRVGAKPGARVVHGYYQLEELQADAGGGSARLLRRFWFDRFNGVHLARIQTFDARGALTTDVVYRNPKPFGEGGKYTLPSEIEITRPQERYSIRISYQTPDAVKVDQPYPPEAFVLENKSNLKVVDLDAKKP
jgi:hypothetical protein